MPDLSHNRQVFAGIDTGRGAATLPGFRKSVIL
jgi:hypothetical protein